MRYLIPVSGVEFLILAALSTLHQAQALNCWTCESKNTATLCEPGESLQLGHSKKGSSQPCPPPNAPNWTHTDGGPAEGDRWACGIIESLVVSTGTVEVAKGCMRYYKYFLIATTPDEIYLEPNKCFRIPIDDDNKYQEVTTCICNTNDCNKKTMALEITDDSGKAVERQIGFRDIDTKLKAKKSAAVTIEAINLYAITATTGLLITVGSF